jgi:DNA repair protein RadD
MIFEDRWYQTEAVESIFSYFMGSTGNPVVALPTGTGKSIVIGRFMQRVLRQWPKQRFLVLTHVKELVEQNAKKLAEMWPTAPIGIYSAGLGRRDTAMSITFGGVASVVNCVEAFGHRDLLLVDECHLISPKADTMYGEVISRLKAINPHLKVVGFTATAFRLGQGMIIEGGIFTDICYDLTGVEAFNRLIAEGFISPLIPKRTRTALDVSNVGMNNGEFAQGALQAAVDKDEITYAALREMVEFGSDRQSWLIFASGVEHAEHIADALTSFGIPAAAIHSKLKDGERDARLAAFKRGELRALSNNNVLTTGFDHPPVDLIGMLRPTMSPGLWVQMLGRGTRPSPATGKRNCLVLDFAGNTKRLGPINDPVIPKRKGPGTGEAPVRICEACGCYNHASARICINCGEEFTFQTKIIASAGTDELLRSDLPVVEYFDVQRVTYNRHQREGSFPVIKVSYFTGLQKFDEWVCLEHSGFPGKKARDWWRQRHADEPPATTDEALQYVARLRVPRRIRVWVNKKIPEVLSHEY